MEQAGDDSSFIADSEGSFGNRSSADGPADFESTARPVCGMDTGQYGVEMEKAGIQSATAP